MNNQTLNISASYSTLCASELLHKVVPLYPIRNPQTCEFWCRGINDSYKVTSDEGSFLLRVYRKEWRGLSEIEFEVGALQHLHSKGAKVAYPLKSIKGSYITSIKAPEGMRHVLITKFADGNALKYKDDNDAILYGRHAAEIHELSSAFTTQHPRYELNLTHLVDEPLEYIRPFFTNRKKDWAFIKRYSAFLSEQVNSAELSELDYGFCHGDFHCGNAHKHNDEVTFFDFDACGFGLRVYDLAVFKWAARLDEKEQERWELFLEGYRQVREISNNDLRLVDTFVAIREIWLMGLLLGNSDDFSKEWMYNTYLDKSITFLRKTAVDCHFESDDE